MLNSSVQQQHNTIHLKVPIMHHTVPCACWAGTTMRTPAGSDVRVTGDLGAACRTVTMDAPLVAPGAAATFRTAEELQEKEVRALLSQPPLK